MRALSWLKDLFSSERGNVLVIGAATLPLLIGSAAFAVDTIQLSVWKRQLQRAADSSAIAGAYALSVGDDTHDAIHRDLDKNRFPTLTQEEGIWTGESHGFSQTVRVQLTATRSLPFISIFTNAASTIVADATAALASSGTFCMVSLYDEEGAGIDVNGNANIVLGCGMKTNALGDDTVTAGGSSSITADPIASRGGIDGDSNNFVEPTTIQPYSAMQADPLAYLDNPTVPNDCNPGTLSVGPQDTLTLSTSNGPICYASYDIKGTLNLTGTNVVLMANGGDIDIQGAITGGSTTVVMTGTNGAAGDLKINAQATLNLTAPNSGDYKGILFYRDRRAPNIEIKINGGAESKLEGALYFPSSDITFAGHASMNVKCLQMVGRILKFRGSANITNKCPTNSGASAFQQTVVRLVA